MGYFDEPKKDTITNVKSGRRFDSGMSVEDILGHANPGVPSSAPHPLQPATPGDSWLDRVFGEPGPIRPEAAFSTFGAGPPAGHPGRMMLPPEIKRNLVISEELKDKPLPWDIRQALEEQSKAAEDEIKNIAEQLANINAGQRGVQQVFDTETKLLEAAGLPSTINAIRNDPEIAATLDIVNKAVETGVGLDEALASMGELSQEERDTVGRAYGRQEWMNTMQMEIRTQVHNLVENRKNIQDKVLEAEDFAKKEAEARQMGTWDSFGDVTPNGRGEDVVAGRMEPWFDANFNGSLSPDQQKVVSATLHQVWSSIPSAEDLEDAEGNIVPFEDLSPENEAALQELGKVLGFPPNKIIDMIDNVRTAIKQGKNAAVQAKNWKTAEQLHPGEADMATAIYNVALDMYDDDTETATNMENSYALHKLIELRSKGNVNYAAGGNLLGLGGLPEHTYTDLGYKVEDVKGNAELQLEALMAYIGYQYGPGEDFFQVALSDYVHNPDTWGDIG